MSDVEKAKKILTSLPEAVEDIKEEVEDVVEIVQKTVEEVKPVVGIFRSLFCCGK
jgi:archaellum component FlaC